MVEHHQRDDVAVRQRVGRCINGVGHGRQRRGACRTLAALLDMQDRHVAQMHRRHGRPGDVPAAPSIGNWRPVIDRPSNGVLIRIVRQREHAHGEQSGNSGCVLGQVTFQALCAARELRAPLADLRQLVKHRSLPWIHRRDLERVGSLHPADRHLVVEEQRPWISRRDADGLQARRGVHQRLGLNWHPQGVEHRAQIARHGVECERDLAGGNPPVQHRDRVGRRARPVFDRGVAQRHEIASLRRQNRRAPGAQCNRERPGCPPHRI